MAGQTFLSGFFTLAVTLNTNRAIGILSNIPRTDREQCVISHSSLIHSSVHFSKTSICHKNMFVWQICTVCMVLQAFVHTDQGVLWVKPNLGQLTKQTYKKSNTNPWKWKQLKELSIRISFVSAVIVSLRVFENSFQWAKNKSRWRPEGSV